FIRRLQTRTSVA
ncbi:cytidine and deoxycytidylate deaminase zinc-binding region family protein, partial [Vibrio parahaemolyticus V-223/04]